jgi:hypothetical protein
VSWASFSQKVPGQSVERHSVKYEPRSIHESLGKIILFLQPIVPVRLHRHFDLSQAFREQPSDPGRVTQHSPVDPQCEHPLRPRPMWRADARRRAPLISRNIGSTGIG